MSISFKTFILFLLALLLLAGLFFLFSNISQVNFQGNELQAELGD